MIKVKTTIIPEKPIDFKDICSFKTNNFTGIWNHSSNSFVIIQDSDIEFNMTVLPKCYTLDELNDAVYYSVGEHIESVSESSTYTFTIEEENN